MPAISCSTAIPRSWPPAGLEGSNENWIPSSTWSPAVGFQSVPNAAHFREKCGDAAIVSPPGEPGKLSDIALKRAPRSVQVGVHALDHSYLGRRCDQAGLNGAVFD